MAFEFSALVSSLKDYEPKERAAIRVAQDRRRAVRSGKSEVGYMEYTMWQAGAEYQHERIESSARFAAKRAAGDFVEIGSFLGETTVLLAKVARELGRKVFVIDPYETGGQNCGGQEYPFFLEQIEPFAESVTHWRARSEDEAIVSLLRRMEIAFAFVDGLHTYDAARQDIENVKHAALVAVDDMNMAPVRLAFVDTTESGCSTCKFPFLREAYLHSYLR